MWFGQNFNHVTQQRIWIMRLRQNLNSLTQAESELCDGKYRNHVIQAESESHDSCRKWLILHITVSFHDFLSSLFFIWVCKTGNHTSKALFNWKHWCPFNLIELQTCSLRQRKLGRNTGTEKGKAFFYYIQAESNSVVCKSYTTPNTLYKHSIHQQ